MAYTIEVYSFRQKAETNPITYALYIMFFPQLLAGPIERPQHLLPQLNATHSFDGVKLESGLRLMLWGFFKKLAIADVLALTVNQIFSHPSEYQGFAILLGAYFFSIQLYCDFSGYSDIARGAARILGIDLVENFRFPLLAQSVREYWSRWHLSLLGWFRDYVYLPLGGSRRSKAVNFRNLMVVFLLSGLWHGANWTFVVWGFLNGLYIALGRTLRLKFNENWKYLNIFFSFHLISLSYIFFRSSSVSIAISMIEGIFGSGWKAPESFDYRLSLAGTLLCSLLLLFEFLERRFAGVTWLDGKSIFTRGTAYYLLLMVTLGISFFGNTLSNEQPFIYFQF